MLGQVRNSTDRQTTSPQHQLEIFKRQIAFFFLLHYQTEPSILVALL